jgi:phenol 2-monooxygenase
MSAAKLSYDVVICGAGPVGLLIAYYLSRAGLSVFVAGKYPACHYWKHVLIVPEKLERDEQSSYGRACTLHQRTLEMLDQVDLFDDMSQIGVVSRNANNWDKNGERAPARGWQSLMSKSEPTYFDFALNIRQKFSEDVFRKRLALHGGKVDVLWTVESFVVNKTGLHPVQVTLQHIKSHETKQVFWYSCTENIPQRTF